MNLRRFYIADDEVCFQKEFIYTWSDKKQILNTVKDWKIEEKQNRLRFFIKRIFEIDKINFSKGHNDLG